MSVVRKALVWSLALGFVLLVACARILSDGYLELRAGKEAAARADYASAILRYRRAAHAYLPGSPFCARAYSALEQLALQAEAQGRNEQALAAWRAIRASSLGTRWLMVPESARLERANQHLAALMAELPAPPSDQGKDRGRLREEHLALLREDHSPQPAWVLVLGAGLTLWLGAAVWAAWKGFDGEDRVVTPVFLRAGAVFSFGLVLFVLALVKA